MIFCFLFTNPLLLFIESLQKYIMNEDWQIYISSTSRFGLALQYNYEYQLSCYFFEFFIPSRESRTKRVGFIFSNFLSFDFKEERSSYVQAWASIMLLFFVIHW